MYICQSLSLIALIFISVSTFITATNVTIIIITVFKVKEGERATIFNINLSLRAARRSNKRNTDDRVTKLQLWCRQNTVTVVNI